MDKKSFITQDPGVPCQVEKEKNDRFPFVATTVDFLSGACAIKPNTLVTCTIYSSVVFFRIDVTLDIRTDLYGIRLLIDNLKTLDRVFISKRDCGEESRIAERQREGECVCVRGSTVRKRRDGVGLKMSHQKKYMWKTMCD